LASENLITKSAEKFHCALGKEKSSTGRKSVSSMFSSHKFQFHHFYCRKITAFWVYCILFTTALSIFSKLILSTNDNLWRLLLIKEILKS
jgi:hypothetical protein